VSLTTEGDCGLDMELQHASRGIHPLHDANRYVSTAMRIYGLTSSTTLTKRAPSWWRCAERAEVDR
jgi:phosphopantetheinyl transferase